MHYPLGNDEHGAPIDVPPQATGWLVRRHGGGRGRPGAVYGADGRPLVLPLDATAVALREAAVGVGAYRLDAVDDQRQSVGASAAYTELIDGAGDGGGVEGAKPASSLEATLALLARLIEKDHQARADERRQDRDLLRQALVQNHETVRAIVGRNVELTAPRLNEPTLKAVDQIKERVQKEAAASEARRNGAAGSGAGEGEGEGDAWVSLLVPVLQPLLTPLVGVAAQEVSLWRERRRQAHDARLAEKAVTRNAAVAPAVVAVTGPQETAMPCACAHVEVEEEGEDLGGERELVDDEEMPAASAESVVSAESPADELGPEALKPLLATLGIPVADVEVLADRLDVVLTQLPAEAVAAMGKLMERASPAEWTVVRELLTPMARMSRADALEYAKAKLVPMSLGRLGKAVSPKETVIQ